MRRTATLLLLGVTSVVLVTGCGANLSEKDGRRLCISVGTGGIAFATGRATEMGIPQNQAADVVRDAVDTYCPQYAGID